MCCDPFSHYSNVYEVKFYVSALFPKITKKCEFVKKVTKKGVEKLFFWIYTRFIFWGMVWMIPHQYLIKFSWKKHVKGVKKIPQSFPRLDCTYCSKLAFSYSGHGVLNDIELHVYTWDQLFNHVKVNLNNSFTLKFECGQE